MANHQVKNAAASTVYLKATGDGSNGDPFIIEHLETNSAAIKTSVEILDNAIAGNEMQVDVVTLPNVTLAAGTNTNEIVGDVADDAATGGNPVYVGGLAKPIDGTDPGSVDTENDRAAFVTDMNRRLLVSQAHPNLWRVNENHSSAQTNNNLKAAPGANLSLYITDIMFSSDTNCTFAIIEDESGTPVTLSGPHYYGARGGIAMPLITPIKMTANKSLGFTQVGGGNYTVELHGYIAP